MIFDFNFYCVTVKTLYTLQSLQINILTKDHKFFKYARKGNHLNVLDVLVADYPEEILSLTKSILKSACVFTNSDFQGEYL